MAKWATAGACTWVCSVLCAGLTCVRTVVEQGAGEAGSGRRQHEGDVELHGLSLAPVYEGKVVRCRAEKATRRRCARQRWRGADACVRALS
jgi:hypothetical protein